MKVISAGIIILNLNNQILGCRAFGKQGRFDIPKGKIEEGENPLQAVIRETMEETGLDISGFNLEDLGLHPYQKGKKDLYLFKTIYDIDDLSSLYCDSYFSVGDMSYPEMDGYEWIDFDKIDDKFYISLSPVLKKVLKIVN